VLRYQANISNARATRNRECTIHNDKYAMPAHKFHGMRAEALWLAVKSADYKYPYLLICIHTNNAFAYILTILGWLAIEKEYWLRISSVLERCFSSYEHIELTWQIQAWMSNMKLTGASFGARSYHMEDTGDGTAFHVDSQLRETSQCSWI
jgi:hypothetical protein